MTGHILYSVSISMLLYTFAFFELYQSEVRGKIYRLLYELNKNVTIKVQTPVGETESVDIGPTITQGSVDAAVISANNMSNGVEEAFEDSNSEIMYKELKLAPLVFLDDIGRMGDDRNSAQEANEKVEAMVDSKQLSLNLDKSSYMIFGNQKSRKKIRNQIKANPITLNGIVIKEEKKVKYLGDFLKHDLSDSVHQTVIKRITWSKCWAEPQTGMTERFGFK